MRYYEKLQVYKLRNYHMSKGKKSQKKTYENKLVTTFM